MANDKFITETTRARIDKALLARLKPGNKPYQVWDPLVSGYHVHVGKTGSISYRLFYRANGKQAIYTIGRDRSLTPRRARAEAQRLLVRISEGGDPAAEKREARLAQSKAKGRTLEALLTGDYWTLHLVSRKTGKQTQERVRRAWRPFLHKDVATIALKQLAAHRAERLRSGIKPQTLNRDRNALLTLFAFAKSHGLIKANPLESVKPLETENDQRVRWLGQRDKDETHNAGERERFMVALANRSPMIQAIVRLALTTGMRRGEIFSLTWDRVSLERRQLTVAASSTKSATTRQVPLNDSAMEVLREWKRHQGNVVQLSGLVFPSPQTGEKLTTIKTAWKRLVTEAQVVDYTLHDCRHDFASRLVQAGTPLYEVSKLLGHSSLELTQRYAHLSDESLLNAARRAELSQI